VRIQPYVSRELQRKLRTYSETRRLTESAVTEAALAEYLDRDQVEAALVVRRLDGLAETVGQLQHDLDVVGQVLAVYVRYSFLAAPAVPTREVRHRADVVFADFLATVAKQLKAGTRLTGEVYGAGSAAPLGGRGPAQTGR
jgi:predicted transcriptional regulator